MGAAQSTPEPVAAPRASMQAPPPPPPPMFIASPPQAMGPPSATVAQVERLQANVNALTKANKALVEEVAALKKVLTKPLDVRIKEAVGPWTKWEQSADLMKQTTTSLGSFKVGGVLDGTAKFTSDFKGKVDVDSFELGLKGFEFAGVPSTLTYVPLKDKADIKGKIKPVKGVALDITQPVKPEVVSPSIVMTIETKGEKGGKTETKVDLMKHTASLKFTQSLGVGEAIVTYGTKEDVWTAAWKEPVGGGDLALAVATSGGGDAMIDYDGKVDKCDVKATASMRKKEATLKVKYKGALTAEVGTTLTRQGAVKPLIKLSKAWDI